uniref:Cation_ATPase_C domain-containing protein n=1 Tax=Macrostomum lignano TaxID=282301 RepID=A0A1I8F9V7_9PLAT
RRGRQAKEEVLKQQGEEHLQAKLTTLAIRIGNVGSAIAPSPLLSWLIIKYCVETFAQPPVGTGDSFDFCSRLEEADANLLLFAVTVIVVAVPEGLPLAVTLSLAYSVKKMMNDNNLLGIWTPARLWEMLRLFAADKTGTLTTNRMTVVQSFVAGTARFGARTRRASTKRHREQANRAAKADWQQDANAPLLGYVEAMGRNYDDYRREVPEEAIHKIYTFNSVRKSMSNCCETRKSGRLRDGAGQNAISFWTSRANRNPFQGLIRTALSATLIEPMASDGLRTICIAYKDFVPASAGPGPSDAAFKEEPNWDDEDFISASRILSDRRPAAIRQCQSAGICVRMVTGDNVNTASIHCFEMRHFETRRKLLGARRQGVWPKLRVLARSSPQDKYTLVSGIIASKITASREVVAVTGDGTQRWSGFEEGRRRIRYGPPGHRLPAIQLTVNVVAVAVARDTPLRAIQMLWVNLIMDTLASLALATELPSDELLERDKIMDTPIQFGSPVPTQHFTAIFNAFVMMTLFNEVNARKIHDQRNRNIIFVIIWLTTFALQVIIVQVGGMVFRTRGLDLSHWLWCLCFGAGSLVWHQCFCSDPSCLEIGGAALKKRSSKILDEENADQVGGLGEV